MIIVISKYKLPIVISIHVQNEYRKYEDLNEVFNYYLFAVDKQQLDKYCCGSHQISPDVTDAWRVHVYYSVKQQVHAPYDVILPDVNR